MSDAPPRKRALLEKDADVLNNFLIWCTENKIELSSKIQTVSKGTSHRYGMLANEKIDKSEVLFTIPRKALLWENNCSKLKFDKVSIKCKSGWVKLLLVLMLEYTDQQTKWRPYLEFLPSVETLDLPLFWPKDLRNEALHGTDLSSAVEKDVGNIEDEYNNIALPYMLKNTHLGFDAKIHTLDLFKHMVGCVMAYSFTDPDIDLDKVNPPKMVPVADVLNHIAKHNAELQFEENCLKMVAIKDIDPGCEIFNTYGELSNSELLQLYGFVEEYPNNIYDRVEFPMDSLKYVSREVPNFEEKWLHLFGEATGVLEGCDGITIGMDMIISFEELKLILEVMRAPGKDFRSKQEDEEIDDSDSDSDVIELLPFSKVRETFSLKLCSMLKQMAQAWLDEMRTSYDKKMNCELLSGHSERKKKILTMINGHICILTKLIESC